MYIYILYIWLLLLSFVFLENGQRKSFTGANLLDVNLLTLDENSQERVLNQTIHLIQSGNNINKITENTN